MLTDVLFTLAPWEVAILSTAGGHLHFNSGLPHYRTGTTGPHSPGRGPGGCVRGQARVTKSRHCGNRNLLLATVLTAPFTPARPQHPQLPLDWRAAKYTLARSQLQLETAVPPHLIDFTSLLNVAAGWHLVNKSAGLASPGACRVAAFSMSRSSWTH